MGREEGSGWGTHVYLWQIHFDIWQNQYNIVKLNKIKLKKKEISKIKNYLYYHATEVFSSKIFQNTLLFFLIYILLSTFPWRKVQTELLLLLMIMMIIGIYCIQSIYIVLNSFNSTFSKILLGTCHKCPVL